MTSTIHSNLRKGVEWGLYVAIVFILLATVVVLVRRTDLEAEYNLTYWQLVAIYLIGGLAGGTLAGFLLPLCRSTLGSMFAGFVAILPFAFLISLAITPQSDWGAKIPLLPLLGSAIAGPLGAT